MKNSLWISLLSFVCLLAVTAQAQKNEFAAEASGLFPSTNNLSIDPAAGFQLNYAHRLIGVPGVALYVEVPFLAGFNNLRTAASLINGQNYSSLFVTPGVKVKFVPSFFISPYLAGGIGVVHFSASNSSGSEIDFA